MKNFIIDRLTSSQVKRICYRKLERHMLPPGCRLFNVYYEPHGSSEVLYVPHGKTLQHEILEVKESKQGFSRVNFFLNPIGPDFWLRTTDLCSRTTSDFFFMLYVIGPLMVIWNFINGKTLVEEGDGD